MQKATSFNDVAIVSIKEIIIVSVYGPRDVISIMKNSDLNEKRGLSWFFSYV